MTVCLLSLVCIWSGCVGRCAAAVGEQPGRPSGAIPLSPIRPAEGYVRKHTLSGGQDLMA